MSRPRPPEPQDGRQRLALVLPWPTAGTTFGFVADLPPPTATPGIGFDVVRLESQ
jgi:hypothetical protein